MADNKNKRWALTVYEDQYKILEEVAQDSLFTKQIGWQDEVCGSTGRKHRQAYIITQQPVRFSAIKSRLPGVHIEVCRDMAALKKYCFKEDTRDPDGSNKETTHPPTHVRVDMFLDMIAQDLLLFEGDKHGNPPTRSSKKELKDEYWRMVSGILVVRPELAALAMQPGPQTLWMNTRDTWIGRAQRGRAEIE